MGDDVSSIGEVERIDAVIVDTSAYCKVQCDFEGIYNSIIPALLELLRVNNITLLTHPVLESEILKHISESELLKKFVYLEDSLGKYAKQLELIGFSLEEITEKINALNLEQRLVEGFTKYYKDANCLPYGDPQGVFEDYFQEKAPFDCEAKKCEFPDAFVLKGIGAYCAENPSSRVLAITDDSDWGRVLNGNVQIVIKDNLEDGMLLLRDQLKNEVEFCGWLIELAEEAICSSIEQIALHEAYDIPSISSSEPKEVDISRIAVKSIVDKVVPLKVSSNGALMQVPVLLTVDGCANYFDDNNSVWDSEEWDYIFRSYAQMDFWNASADVECELQFSYPNIADLGQAKLESAKFLNTWDIDIRLDGVIICGI